MRRWEIDRRIKAQVQALEAGVELDLVSRIGPDTARSGWFGHRMDSLRLTGYEITGCALLGTTSEDFARFR